MMGDRFSIASGPNYRPQGEARPRADPALEVCRASNDKMDRVVSRFLVILSLVPIGLASVAAQAPSRPADEARVVAEGRALLAQGDLARAVTLGRTLSAQFPNSAGVLEFAVDAEIAQGGSVAGLQMYERWTSLNQIEDAPALHQIARAALRESVQHDLGPARKVAVLQALAADGDADAAAALAGDMLQQEAGPGLLAAIGNDRAVSALIAQLQSPLSAERRRAILALGQSRSRRAVAPLIDRLSDPSFDVRAAAAEALGGLGASQAVGPLKLLLNDPIFSVHYAAAAALVALNDPSGAPWLRQLANHPEPSIRLAAVQALRPQPDNAWIGLVRDLTTAADPEIRRQAAELLAPHDPAGARMVLEPLLSDANVAERDAAASSYLHTETELTALRRYLRGGSADRRTEAALRIHELTR